MSKALFGTHALPSSVHLLDEVQRLRARVAELEEALAVAEAAAAQHGPTPAATKPVDAEAVHAPAGH